jgi:hypothetical protein
LKKKKEKSRKKQSKKEQWHRRTEFDCAAAVPKTYMIILGESAMRN